MFKSIGVKESDGKTELVSHAGYANALLEEWTVEVNGVEIQPIGTRGVIYYYNPEKKIWLGYEDITIDITSRFAGQEHCKVNAHYGGIAKTAYSLCSRGNSRFFDDAPLGLATPSGFHTISGDGVLECVELGPDHRQTSICEIEPDRNCPTPLWTNLIHDTFSIFNNGVLHEGDTDAQVDVLQEATGGALIRGFYKSQKAMLIKGEGANGKGVVTEVLESVFPRDVVTAVSPTTWGNDTACSKMAGSHLNVVGEMDKKKYLPDGRFKDVTGWGLINCRNLYGVAYEAIIVATQWFLGQYFPSTIDQSYAFWRRWILLSAPNIVPESSRDKDLSKKIQKNEMPGVLWWMLEGASRFVANGYEFSASPAHDRLMSEWKLKHTPVLAFLHECSGVEMTPSHSCDRAGLYTAFRDWSTEGGMHPMNKHNFNDEMFRNGFASCKFGVRPQVGEKDYRTRGFKGVGVLDYNGDIITAPYGKKT